MKLKLNFVVYINCFALHCIAKKVYDEEWRRLYYNFTNNM